MPLRSATATTRRVALAAALGLVVVLAGLVLVLAQRDKRLAGTNSLVASSGIALEVRPGAQRCAADQVVPKDTAAVRLYVGTYHRPSGVPFAVTVRDGARVVASGRAPGGYPDNARLDVPLERIDREIRGARVCVRNLGARRIGLAGNLTPPVGPVPLGRDVARTDWLLAGEPTWWDVAPRIARRATVFKPGFVGAWTFWVLLGVVAAMWAAGLTVLLRRVASEREES